MYENVCDGKKENVIMLFRPIQEIFEQCFHEKHTKHTHWTTYIVKRFQ